MISKRVSKVQEMVSRLSVEQLVEKDSGRVQTENKCWASGVQQWRASDVER